MNKIITEELINQIRLMNYDRSKTLLEQGPTGDTKNQIKKKIQTTDRLGSDFRATPKIFSDPVYKEYQNLSPEEKQKRENEFLNKKWKSRLCTTNAQQKGSVYNGEYYVSHEDFCKPFGGPQVYRTKSEGKSFLGISEKDVLGEGFFCGCKVNGQTFIGDKTVKVNEYLNRPMTEITYPIADFLSEPHNIAMIASLALTIFSGGALAPLLLATGIDLADAYFYYQEGDPYMAGIALFFTLLPGGMSAYKISKNSLKSLKIAFAEANALSKATGKKVLPKLTSEQKGILETLNNLKLRKVAFTNLIKTTLMGALKKLQGIPLVGFIFWLVEKSILPAKFVFKFGLTFFGLTYTWDQIATFLGIEKKGSLDTTFDVKKSIKPFDLETQKKTEYINLLYQVSNKTLSRKNENSFDFGTLLVQYLLYVLDYGNMGGELKPQIKWNKKDLVVKNSNKIKEIKIFDVYGKQLKSLTNKDLKKELKISNLDLKGTSIVRLINKDDKSTNIKIVPNMDLNTDVSFSKISKIPKWGYFDEWTEVATENFQRDKGLTQDGVVGNDTINELIKILKTDKIKMADIKKVEGFANIDLDKEIEKTKQKTEQEMYEKLNKKIIEEELKRNEENIKDSILRNVEKIDISIDSLDKVLNSLNDEFMLDK